MSLEKNFSLKTKRGDQDKTARLKPQLLPRHIAIIMDGNGRWAKTRGLPVLEGHRRGVEAIRETIRTAGEWGIPYLTIYSFSSENWNRPESEVAGLMALFKRFLRQDLAELHNHNVKLRMIGERIGLEPEILSLIEEAERLTASNTGLHLTVAFNYGARNEILRAMRRVAQSVREGQKAAADITEEDITAALDTAGLPDPDLVIRTSGERRLSNFLLWQIAYAEFVFPQVYWPDFTRAEFAKALQEYFKRDRRFGRRKMHSKEQLFYHIK